jgi:hypothetical protein
MVRLVRWEHVRGDTASYMTLEKMIGKNAYVYVAGKSLIAMESKIVSVRRVRVNMMTMGSMMEDLFPSNQKYPLEPHLGWISPLPSLSFESFLIH